MIDILKWIFDSSSGLGTLLMGIGAISVPFIYLFWKRQEKYKLFINSLNENLLNIFKIYENIEEVKEMSDAIAEFDNISIDGKLYNTELDLNEIHIALTGKICESREILKKIGIFSDLYNIKKDVVEKYNEFLSIFQDLYVIETMKNHKLPIEKYSPDKWLSSSDNNKKYKEELYNRMIEKL